jgi:RHS repeat-associated protein
VIPPSSRELARSAIYHKGPGPGRARRSLRRVRFQDQQGTQTLAINSTTLAVTERFYDPYGNAVGTAASAWPGDQGFQNGTADTATGLTDVGAREYDSGTASFISPDPLLAPGDPQDLNPYAYAQDAPPPPRTPPGRGRPAPTTTPSPAPSPSKPTRPPPARAGRSRATATITSPSHRTSSSRKTTRNSPSSRLHTNGRPHTRPASAEPGTNSTSGCAPAPSAQTAAHAAASSMVQIQTTISKARSTQASES